LLFALSILRSVSVIVHGEQWWVFSWPSKHME